MQGPAREYRPVSGTHRGFVRPVKPQDELLSPILDLASPTSHHVSLRPFTFAHSPPVLVPHCVFDPPDLCSIVCLPHRSPPHSGEIGLTAFRCIMRDPRMSHIPLILETPAADKPLEVGELAVWVKEIKLLHEIQAIADDEWPAKRSAIEKRWRADRDVMNPPKEPKGKAKNAKKAKKGKKDEDEDEGCESCSDD